MSSKNLHRKQLGTIGELRVAQALMLKGYSVFTELGDLAKVDLITLVDSLPVKIQVKTRHLLNGVVKVKSSKDGPNYSYAYTSQDFDVLAVYVIELDEIVFIHVDELLSVSEITIRFSEPRNSQSRRVRKAETYKSFERALRGHTGSTLSSGVEGDEMVQTTTDLQSGL